MQIFFSGPKLLGNIIQKLWLNWEKLDADNCWGRGGGVMITKQKVLIKLGQQQFS